MNDKTEIVIGKLKQAYRVWPEYRDGVKQLLCQVIKQQQKNNELDSQAVNGGSETFST